MVEVRQVAVLAAHAAAAVEQEEDLLVAFVLVFAGDRRAFASGGLPVDLAQGVAVAEFAQLVELRPRPRRWPPRTPIWLSQWSTAISSAP